MKPSLLNKPDKVLFIRLRLLGDIVFTIPAVQMFKSRFPGTQIYYVAEEPFKEIAQLIPGIHETIVIPRKMGLRAMWSFRRKIKALEIDTVIDFHSGPKSAQLTRISGARHRIGYRTPNRNWAYNRLIPRMVSDNPTHSVFNQVRLLEPFGIEADEKDLPQYPEIKPDETGINDWVKEIAAKKKKTVIHVGAGNDFRDWGKEKFETLIDVLLKQNITVLLVGKGPKEEQRAADLTPGRDVINLAGKLSITELYYLVSRSSVYFGADSGPLHLASLTPTPLVALYGPNVPGISGPWRKNKVTIIQKKMDCRPCDQRTCIYGIIPCMKNISTEEVYEAIMEYIK